MMGFKPGGERVPIETAFAELRAACRAAWAAFVNELGKTWVARFVAWLERRLG